MEIADVDRLSPFLHIGVFAHKQPADVSEEEPALGIVWIGLRLRVFVVHTMVPGPLYDVILKEQFEIQTESPQLKPRSWHKSNSASKSNSILIPFGSQKHTSTEFSPKVLSFTIIRTFDGTEHHNNPLGI